MACSREAAVVYSLHGGGSQEVTAWYCEESRYVVFVFQMIPLNRSQRQAHPCSAKRHGYDLPRVTFVRLSRKPNGSTGVSSYSGVNATWRRSRNLMVRRASPPVTPLWLVARGQAPAI